jgi:D-glycero-alpha-D-manno-heptose-7-phosphate kinase
VTGLVARASLRADLAGGTLDLWPLHLFHPGASTVNVALRIKAKATYQPGGRSWVLEAGDLGARRSIRHNRVRSAALAAGDGDPFALALQVMRHFSAAPPGRVSTFVDGPPGGGLAGSSALMVALIGMASRAAGSPLRRADAAPLARDLEARVLGLPTGVQDYYPALYGGALQLVYEPGGIRVERIDCDLAGLEKRTILAYSGKPHSSAPSNWGLYRRRLEGEELARECFQSIADAACAAARALRRGDWPRLGAAMNADWAARKRLEPALAPPDLCTLERAGLEAGALAAKCCGAASGGTMLFFVRHPRQRGAVTAALERCGARLIPFRVARTGLAIRNMDGGA